MRDIPFHSLCEHHLLPFHGVAHIAYLPGERIVGLSKLARVLEHFARDLQVQERLTQQVADLAPGASSPRAASASCSRPSTCAWRCAACGSAARAPSPARCTGSCATTPAPAQEFFALAGLRPCTTRTAVLPHPSTRRLEMDGRIVIVGGGLAGAKAAQTAAQGGLRRARWSSSGRRASGPTSARRCRRTTCSARRTARQGFVHPAGLVRRARRRAAPGPAGRGARRRRPRGDARRRHPAAVRRRPARHRLRAAPPHRSPAPAEGLAGVHYLRTRAGLRRPARGPGRRRAAGGHRRRRLDRARGRRRRPHLRQRRHRAGPRGRPAARARSGPSSARVFAGPAPRARRGPAHVDSDQRHRRRRRDASPASSWPTARSCPPTSSWWASAPCRAPSSPRRPG